MDARFFHGPDKAPLTWDSSGTLASEFGVPFHGIASRGMVSWLANRPDGSMLWERLGHLLHDPAETAGPALRELREAARERGVLSFSQSAAAALRYVADQGNPESDGTMACELWNIKEGHTSSVWLATPEPGIGAKCRQFVINISRDNLAAGELRRTSRCMQELAARIPDLAIAAVHDIATVAVAHGDAMLDVTVTRNAYVADALEIHRMPREPGSPERYLLVERFITDPETPTRIRAIRGRIAAPHEHAAIDGVVRQFRLATDPDDHVSLNIDDGDVVWDGQVAVIVAIGAC